MTSTSHTHPSLLSGLRRQHEPSWERLVDLFGPMVYEICRRSGLSSEAAADVMQETFLSVSKSLATFQYRDSSDTFRGWLCRIAQRRVADFHRRRSAVVSAVGGSELRDAIEAVADAATDLDSDSDNSSLTRGDMRGVVDRAAALVQAEVEPRSWSAFWMTAIEGQAATQVAKELGMQPAAVRKAKSRIARRLREVIGDVDEDPELPR